LRDEGFSLDPYETKLGSQVIHVRIPATASLAAETFPTANHGDLFIFPSGTLVAWNVSNQVTSRLVKQVLATASINPHINTVDIDEEDMQYVEDDATDRSKIVGDTIVIGTKIDQEAETAPEVDTILTKVAFSSGLARSTKLAVLETLTDTYFESTRSIPFIMSKGTPLPVTKPKVVARMFKLMGFGSRLPFSRSFILRKTGELLSIRAQLNLYSELTDSLPDLFWDSRHELGLEGYYDLVGRALDVGIRIKVLNEKMDYAQEIASVLRETLSERHNLRLEWGIIVLIFIEVLFEITQRFNKSSIETEYPQLLDLISKQIEHSRNTPSN
jgi:uncharacterized Rmd1/YagE family protein